MSRGLTPSPGELMLEASTVLIFNLGWSLDMGILMINYEAIIAGKLVTSIEGDEYDEGLQDLVAAANAQSQGDLILGGAVLFCGNQCVLEARKVQGYSFLLPPSLLIFSLDDIGFQNNQCDSRALSDVLTTQALLFGLTVRANGNRFQEGLYLAYLSAMIFGLANTTTDNQSSNCLLVRGWPEMTVSAHNRVLATLVDKNACRDFESLSNNFGGDGHDATVVRPVVQQGTVEPVEPAVGDKDAPAGPEHEQ